SQRIHVLRQMQGLLQPAETPARPGAATMAADPEFSNRQTGLAAVPAGETLNQGGESCFPSAALPESVPGYELLGELGRGGMGVVYKARQQSLTGTVALKMILAGGHASAGAMARFLKEAATIARLKHPHVVQVHEFGTHAGKPYFSLEFLEGGSLADKLRGEP